MGCGTRREEESGKREGKKGKDKGGER